jgi:hypothetical protein
MDFNTATGEEDNRDGAVDIRWKTSKAATDFANDAGQSCMFVDPVFNCVNPPPICFLHIRGDCNCHRSDRCGFRSQDGISQ